MENFSSNGISSQLIIIFTLVLVVGLLLVVIIFLDKKEKLKKKKNDYEEDYDNNFTFEDLYQKDAISSPNISIDEEEIIETVEEKEMTPYTENILKEESKVLEEIKVDEILIPKLKEMTNKIENFKPLEEDEINIISTSDFKDIEEQNEEEIYIDDELEKTQAQLELKRLTEELEKASSEENNAGLTEFELEQEENAIISLEELTKLSDKLYDENENTQYNDEGDEPITIEQLKEKFKKDEPKEDINIEEQNEEYQQVTLDDFITIDNNLEPFKSSPIISPVYGIEQISLKDELKLDVQEEQIEEANRDELEIEMRKTSEFLQTLKELRKNLE